MHPKNKNKLPQKFSASRSKLSFLFPSRRQCVPESLLTCYQKPLKPEKKIKENVIVWNAKFYHPADFELKQIKTP